MDYITLNNDVQMPLLGLGVFQVEAPTVCEQSVTDAIRVGYRLIDTAATYLKERIEENFQSFGFELSEEEMARIATCDTGHPVIGDFDNPEFVYDLCNRKYDI